MGRIFNDFTEKAVDWVTDPAGRLLAYDHLESQFSLRVNTLS